MATASFFKRNWKLLLNIFTVGALLILIIAIHKELGQTFAQLRHVRIWAVLLIIPLEFIDYHAQAKLYQSLFKTLGTRLSYRPLLRLSVELNFVNHVFPSGGASGVSYFSLRLKAMRVRASQAAVVQIMKLVLIFVTFELLLLIGIVALAAMGHVNNLLVLVATMISTGLFIGTFVFMYVVGSQQRINTALTWITRLINRLIHLLHLGHAEVINVERARVAFDELHANYMLFRSHIGDLKAPFWYGFLANMVEVLAVYIFYVAFGHWVNIGAVILAYAVANFAGLISITPGGVGVYEALMTGVLASAGVPAELAIPVTIMYRVVSTAVQVPLGFVLYNHTIHRTPQATDKQAPSQ